VGFAHTHKFKKVKSKNFITQNFALLKKTNFIGKIKFCLKSKSQKLSSQGLSAFSTSSKYNFSAISGSHSFSKTMNLTSLSFFWLKCHFHYNAPPFTKLCPSTSSIILDNKKQVK